MSHVGKMRYKQWMDGWMIISQLGLQVAIGLYILQSYSHWSSINFATDCLECNEMANILQMI